MILLSDNIVRSCNCLCTTKFNIIVICLTCPYPSDPCYENASCISFNLILNCEISLLMTPYFKVYFNVTLNKTAGLFSGLI